MGAARQAGAARRALAARASRGRVRPVIFVSHYSGDKPFVAKYAEALGRSSSIAVTASRRLTRHVV